MLKNNKVMKCLFLFSTVTFCLTLAVVMTAYMAVFSVQVPVEVQAQGEQQQQQQQQQPQETFFESALRSSNESSIAQGQQAQQQSVPTLNSDFVWQGQVSSQPVQLREGEVPQSAIILPTRDDSAIYSGIITYQTSRPVDLIVLNILNPGNTTAIPEQFGDLNDIITIDDQLVSINEIGSGESGSMPFTGNAVGFISDDEEPFLVTYTLTAVPEQARIVNDITSLLGFNAILADEAAAVAEEEEEEEEDH